MEETMRVVKIEGGYAFKRDIQDAYFYPNEMGNFQVKTWLKRLAMNGKFLKNYDNLTLPTRR